MLEKRVAPEKMASMKTLWLRSITAEDLPAVVALDQRSLGGLWTLAGYQRELDSLNSDILILQPDASATILGMACLWEILEEAHITLIAVDPPFQRQGLGQTLLYALLVRAWQRQLEWATLEVRPSNLAAIALYRQFGFQEIGQRKGYYQDTGENALILWRDGLQKPDFVETLTTWQKQLYGRLQRAGWQLETALGPYGNPPFDRVLHP
jgi:ribosomal-protein-alanine N-acetyltransferase